MKLSWFIRRPRTFGAHAVALTAEGKIVLVKLRYARGWRLPGGGRHSGEDPRDAALRELREEIGLVSHGEIQLACEFEQTPDFKRDLAALLIVRDVRYHPKWSWEVEAILEAEPDQMPADVAPLAVKWLEAVRDRL